MTKRLPIYGLDLIRLAAALMVLTYHIAYKPLYEHPIPGAVALTAAGPWWGWIGVQIFFVISGLVISYSAVGATPERFVRGRIARLWPTMLICAIMAALIDVLVTGLPVGRTTYLFVKSITFAPLGPWLAGQFWTLPIEIVFYGVVWLMILWRRVSLLEPLAWALALASAVYWVAMARFGDHDPMIRLTQLLLFQHGNYFAIGMMLAIIDTKGPRASRLALLAIGALVAIPQIERTMRFEYMPSTVVQSLAVPYLIWLGGTLLIAVSLHRRDAIAARVGSSAAPLLRLCGLVTYPLYLVHMQAGMPLYLAARAAGWPWWTGALAGCVVPIVVATVIATMLEPPLHAKVNAVLKRAFGGIRFGTYAASKT